MLEAAIEQINAAISIAICSDHAAISHEMQPGYDDDPAHQMPLGKRNRQRYSARYIISAQFCLYIFFLLKCIVINVKSLFIFSLSHPEMSLSTRVASSSPFWWLHLYVYKADGCVLDKTVTLWICIQQCCIIYLYVWIYTRRPLVQIYSGGYSWNKSWDVISSYFLFSPPFFSLCVNWKRSYMISETHLHPGAQLAKDKSWGTTMSRAFRHFLLPFPFRRLLRCALTTSDRKSQKIKKKKVHGNCM